MAEKLFKTIHTMGKLPDGRIIEQINSYPLGTNQQEYDRLDNAMVDAFGNENSRTIGTYMDGQGQ